MLRLILTITFMLAFTSCGKLLGNDHVNKDAKRQYSTTNSVFNSYIATYEAQGKAQLKTDNFNVGDIPINFGDTEDDKYDGVCFTYPNGDKEIIIKKSWWDKTSETQKELMIFHELGHCHLGRTHDEQVVNHEGRDIPVTIMNPTIPLSSWYNEYKDGYITEFFTYEKAKMLSALTPAN
jgi:hypothetical protein